VTLESLKPYIDHSNSLCNECYKLGDHRMLCSGLRLNDIGETEQCHKLVARLAVDIPQYKSEEEYKPIELVGFKVFRRTRESVGIMFSTYAHIARSNPTEESLCVPMSDAEVSKYSWNDQVEVLRRMYAAQYLYVDKVDGCMWHEESRERLYSMLGSRRIMDRPTYITYTSELPPQIGYDTK
jgi:hypothetical protein